MNLTSSVSEGGPGKGGGPGDGGGGGGPGDRGGPGEGGDAGVKCIFFVTCCHGYLV